MRARRLLRLRFTDAHERDDVTRELAAHLALHTDELIARGFAPEAARAEAERVFGDMAVARQACTEIRRGRNRAEHRRGGMEGTWQDVRVGARGLRRTPGFTLVAVLTLGIAIGAVCTLFSFVHASLLRPLPYAEGERLIRITEEPIREPGTNHGVSMPMYHDLRAHARSFSSVGAYYPTRFAVTQEERPYEVQGAEVRAEVFDVLGVRPLLGRAPTPDEAQSNAPVALISERLWRTRMNARSDILGSVVSVSGVPYEIIGVMPASFDFPDDESALWLPLVEQEWMNNRAVHILTVVGRLAEGVDAESAVREADALYAAGQQAHQGSDPEHRFAAVSLREALVGDGRRALLLLFGVVLAVLLIACANLAGLQLARGSTRDAELAVRSALGAGRLAIVRQMLVESLLIGVGGALLGLVLTNIAVRTLQQLQLFRIPGLDTVGINPQVLAFAATLTVFTALLFGVLPALRGARVSAAAVLRAGGGARTTSGRAGQDVRRVLVVGEVALAIVLVAAAGMLIRSFTTLQRQDPGFRADDLLLMKVTASATSHPDVASAAQFFTSLPELLGSVPGVRSVTAVSTLPISGGEARGDLAIEGVEFSPGTAPAATFRRSLPGYFETMGTALLAGRDFTATDNGATPVIIVARTLAERHFGSPQAALGRRIRIGPSNDQPWLEIVGVVEDVRNQDLAAVDEYATYEPYMQRQRRTMYVAVRTGVDAATLATTVVDRLATTDPSLLISEVGTMSQRLGASVAQERLSAQLVTALGAIALVLAALGVYGLMAYIVEERRRELGIRAALGATRTHLLRMVVRQGAGLALAGALLGVVGALAAGRLLDRMLYQTSASDPGILATASAVLVVITIIAALIPARRAAGADPLQVMRG